MTYSGKEKVNNAASCSGNSSHKQQEVMIGTGLWSFYHLDFNSSLDPFNGNPFKLAIVIPSS